MPKAWLTHQSRFLHHCDTFLCGTAGHSSQSHSTVGITLGNPLGRWHAGNTTSPGQSSQLVPALAQCLPPHLTSTGGCHCCDHLIWQHPRKAETCKETRKLTGMPGDVSVLSPGSLRLAWPSWKLTALALPELPSTTAFFCCSSGCVR